MRLLFQSEWIQARSRLLCKTIAICQSIASAWVHMVICWLKWNRKIYKGGNIVIRELLSCLNCSTIEHVTNDDISYIQVYVTADKFLAQIG